MFLRNKQSKLRQLFNVPVLSAVIKSGDSGGSLRCEGDNFDNVAVKKKRAQS